MIVIKKEEQTNGDDEKSSSDCTKQPTSVENDINLSMGGNEVEGEREVGLAQVESLCGSNSQDAQTALKLSFTLPASCYATMAIRELLKTSTSVCTPIPFFFPHFLSICPETMLNLGNLFQMLLNHDVYAC